MKSNVFPKLAIRPQHSCYVFEDNDVTVTVYSKKKKSMRVSEVNLYLDYAKKNLLLGEDE